MNKILEIGGVQIAVRIRGNGFPLVFIHGFGEDRTVWSEFTSPLEKEFKILDFDLPGFGKSGHWDKFTISGAAGIFKKILDKMDIQDFILIGHSMGGYISLDFARKFPQFLTGLVMFHSHPYSDTSEKKKGRQKAIEFIGKNGSGPFAKQLVPGMFSAGFAEKHPDTIKKMTEKAASYKPESFIISLKEMKNRKDNSEILEKLACPCLFIIGDEDELIPSDYSLKQTALPAVSSIHILQNVGHMGMIEESNKCRIILQDFARFCFEFQGKK